MGEGLRREIRRVGRSLVAHLGTAPMSPGGIAHTALDNGFSCDNTKALERTGSGRVRLRVILALSAPTTDPRLTRDDLRASYVYELAFPSSRSPHECSAGLSLRGWRP